MSHLIKLAIAIVLGLIAAIAMRIGWRQKNKFHFTLDLIAT